MGKEKSRRSELVFTLDDLHLDDRYALDEEQIMNQQAVTEVDEETLAQLVQQGKTYPLKFVLPARPRPQTVDDFVAMLRDVCAEAGPLFVELLDTQLEHPETGPAIRAKLEEALQHLK